MGFNVHYLLHSHFSHQDTSAATAAIFWVILLQEYRSTHVVSCVVVTTNYICTSVLQ
jgi:hypothetical protein